MPIDTYSDWHKTSVTSLPIFVSVLQRNYPHVHGGITKALELRGHGEACRTAIEDAVDMLFGNFSGYSYLHSAFIYAVVFFILVGSESPRQDELRKMLHRYLYKRGSELPAFQDQCKNPETAALSSAELLAEYSELCLAVLPGYRRLSPDANGAGFEGQWELLFDAATAVLAQMKLPETSEAALALIGSKFADQATGETVGQFFVRLKRAYSDCRSALDRLSCRRLLPHPDTLVQMVFQRTRVEYSTEVRDMLRMSKLTEADLTLDLICSIYSQAAARVAKTFPTLDAAIAEAAARAAKPKPKPDRDRDRATKTAKATVARAVVETVADAGTTQHRRETQPLLGLTSPHQHHSRAAFPTPPSTSSSCATSGS